MWFLTFGHAVVFCQRKWDVFAWTNSSKLGLFPWSQGSQCLSWLSGPCQGPGWPAVTAWVCVRVAVCMCVWGCRLLAVLYVAEHICTPSTFSAPTLRQSVLKVEDVQIDVHWEKFSNRLFLLFLSNTTWWCLNSVPRIGVNNPCTAIKLFLR